MKRIRVSLGVAILLYVLAMTLIVALTLMVIFPAFNADEDIIMFVGFIGLGASIGLMYYSSCSIVRRIASKGFIR